MKTPRIEGMAITRLLDYFDVRAGATEADVSPVLHGGLLERFPERGDVEPEADRYLRAMLRTSIVFALPSEVYFSAFEDWEEATERGEVREAVMPPLPYKRIFFEYHDEDGALTGLSHNWMSGNDAESVGGEITARLLGVAIEEVTVGQTWRILLLAWDAEAEGVVVMSLTANEGDSIKGPVEIVTTAAAHYLDALERFVYNVRIPRGHRREHERRRGFKHPTVYFVALHGPDGRVSGESDRVYTVRWLVRGHWRRYRQGRRAGERTWVKSYIKGPEGAPFKGRPLYHAGDAE